MSWGGWPPPSGPPGASGTDVPTRFGTPASRAGSSKHLPRSELLKPSSTTTSIATVPERYYAKERVLVRVYDLGKTALTRWHNQVTKNYGAFHTGVEVYGHEWSFGMTFDEYSTGVTSNAPMLNPDHSFRETLCMGYTSCSPRQVMQIVEEMKKDWKGCTYNVLSRNCHSFSDAFCIRLGVGGLPAWVNDLADTGAQTVEFLDSADSGYDGGTALFDFLGSVRSKVYSAFTGEPDVPSPLSRPPQTSQEAAWWEQRSPEQQQQQQQQLHDPFSVLRRR